MDVHSFARKYRCYLDFRESAAACCSFAKPNSPSNTGPASPQQSPKVPSSTSAEPVDPEVGRAQPPCADQVADLVGAVQPQERLLRQQRRADVRAELR